MLPAGFNHVLRPDGSLNLANVRLPQEIHAKSGLTDAAAYLVRKFSVENLLVEVHFHSVLGTCNLQLSLHGILINSDTH